MKEISLKISNGMPVHEEATEKGMIDIKILKLETWKIDGAFVSDFQAVVRLSSLGMLSW